MSNAHGKPSDAEVRGILATAGRGGVQVLDTAPSYGDSERVLGRSLPPDCAFRVVSKTPTAADELRSRGVAGAMSESLRRTLQDLNRTSIDGLIVHNARHLLEEGGRELVAAMGEQKSLGRVRAIGVSVYDAEQLDRVLEFFVPDLVQLPANALDQRLVRSGHIRALAAAGVEVHVRSVFLQGLLLMDAEALPSHLSTASPYLSAFRASAERQGLSPMTAALSFARYIEGVAVVLVGVNTDAELRQVLASWDAAGPQVDDLELLRQPPDAVVDPRQWRSQ